MNYPKAKALKAIKQQTTTNHRSAVRMAKYWVRKVATPAIKKAVRSNTPAVVSCFLSPEETTIARKMITEAGYTALKTGRSEITITL